MSLRRKLLLALSPLAVALVVLGVVALWTVGRLGGRSQIILQDNYRSVLAAERMKEAIERLDSAALFVAAGRRDLALAQAPPNLQRFEAELRVEEGNLTEPGEPEAVRRLRALFTDYQAKYAAHLALASEEEARRHYFGVLQPAFLQVKGAADEILGLNQDAMVRKSDRAGSLAEQMNALIVMATLLSCLIGLMLSTTWTTRILRPLSVLTQAVRRLGEGDLQARAALTGDDEIARLAAEFNTMAERLAQYRRSSLGELLQAQQAAQAAIDSLPDPVIVFRTDGAVLNVNRAAEGLLGVSLEAGGPDPLHQVDPAVRQVLERVRAHVVSGKGPYQPRGFEEALRLGGTESYVLPRATPVYGEEGGISGATVVLQDVTRLRRFDELKNDLVATVAHEFRTPLTSLRMAIHLCIEEAAGPINDKQADLLHAAREDCERLQTIVDELLDLARIQAGRIELELRPVGCEGLLEAALEPLRAAASEAGLRLRAEAALDLPEVMADRERVLLVLSNLLQNAIRHTPPGQGGDQGGERAGEIIVRARPEEPEGQTAGRVVRFEVSDTGEGIAPEHQARIFERFFRVPGARSGGAGLGLALSREIVRAHGGEIGVRSQPGSGSTFWFTLPAVQAPG